MLDSVFADVAVSGGKLLSTVRQSRSLGTIDS